MKRIFAMMAVMALVGGMATAQETIDEPSPGVNCTLSNGMTFGTVADMLKYLKDRDGHFQLTVEKYAAFRNVGDLLKQKCATPADG